MIKCTLFKGKESLEGFVEKGSVDQAREGLSFFQKGPEGELVESKLSFEPGFFRGRIWLGISPAGEKVLLKLG